MNTIAVAVAERGDRRGCFLCNTAVDRAPHDPEVERLVKAVIGRLERGLISAVRDTPVAVQWNERRRGQIARSLTTAYLGLRVLAKAGYSPRQLKDTVDTILAEAGLC